MRISTAFSCKNIEEKKLACTNRKCIFSNPINSLLIVHRSVEEEDIMGSSEEMQSLLLLQETLKERKKKRKSKRGAVKRKFKGGVVKDQTDCEDEYEELSVSRWLPKSRHHQICVQARGGKKSYPVSISMPGRTFIPLYDFVSWER